MQPWHGKPRMVLANVNAHSGKREGPSHQQLGAGAAD